MKSADATKFYQLDTTRAALEGYLRALRYLFTPRPWPLELPVVVQFPVNDICDSKCQMCNIWQQKLDRQIGATEARHLFSDPLFARVRAVGLNGGEPTLRPDLADLGEAIADSLPRLRQISLITNGLHADRAIQRIDALADRLLHRNTILDVMVSLDGVGETHDLVRGVPGNFANAVRVLDHLRSRKDDLSVRVGCTIIHDNVYGLHELLDFCKARDVYVKFRLGVPHRRLYNLEPPAPKTIGKRTWIDTQPFALNDTERWHISQFLLGLARDYEPSNQQRFFYRSLADQVLHGAPRRAGCDWQHRGVTVSSRGELMYCAVQSDVLGDVREGGAEQLYFERSDHLEQILKDKCADCAHDYVGMPGGFQQWRILGDSIMRRTGLTRERLSLTQAYTLALNAKRTLQAHATAVERRRLAAPGNCSTLSIAGPMRPVLVCGWYGTETLGDKAILATVISCIRREAPDRPIHVVSLQPALTRLTLAELPETDGCSVIDTEEALRDVGSASVLVFGGGPLMAIREIATMEALFVRARRRGIPSIIAGCGVGPLGARAYRKAIASLLSVASARIYRDLESLDAATALGVDTRQDQISEDPAFAWVNRSVEASKPRPGNRPPTLALGLREWPYQQYAPELGHARAEEIRRNLKQTITTALDRLTIEIPGLRILPIPFCTHDAGGDDRLLYWQLVQDSPNLRAAIDTSTLGRDLGPLEYLHRLQAADACLAMRFHSIVFAVALGKPTVALDYTLGRGKSSAIGRRHALDCLRVDHMDSDTLVARLKAAMQPGAPAPLSDVPLFVDAFHAAWQTCMATTVAQ
jgi:polysaccharide pyruvyl transferase WcaK-like protein/MoaA/NifB/PqqE/SkfB family radical SAM enzyme